MRVAVIAPRAAAPCNRGWSVRAVNLYRHLSARHEVRQLSQLGLTSGFPGLRRETWITPTYRERYLRHPLAFAAAAVGELAWPASPVASGLGLRLARPRALRELLAWADVSLVEFPWQFAECARTRPDALLVYSSCNVEALKFASYAQAQGVWPERSRWLDTIVRMEAAAVRRADLVLAVSAEERLEFVRRYGADPERVVEVPNGADTERYAPTPPALRALRKRELGLPSRPTVLFMGTTAPPNAFGWRLLRRVAAASDRFTFLVVGPVARPERTGSLVATGRVPDILPYLQAADLAVCPIEHGAGTKIKLWESLAAGLPTVASSESLARTHLEDGRHLLVADSTEPALLAALTRLTDDPALAHTLATEARHHLVHHHDWRHSAHTLETALHTLLERGTAGRAPSLAAAGS